MRKGTDVLSLLVDGREAVREIDNTIMRVTLPQPLAPEGRATFEYTFRTHWASGYRRMKLYNVWGFKHYDGTQWYPRISVYDKQHGWDTYQHLGNEFYGDFGKVDSMDYSMSP